MNPSDPSIQKLMSGIAIGAAIGLVLGIIFRNNYMGIGLAVILAAIMGVSLWQAEQYGRRKRGSSTEPIAPRVKSNPRQPQPVTEPNSESSNAAMPDATTTPSARKAQPPLET